MPVYFLDASVLVKRYVTETGSAWVRGITDPAAANDSWICSVSGVEVLSALYRRVRMGTIALAQARRMDLQFRNDLTTNLKGIEPIPAVIHEAMRLISTYPLRAHDALQLAAAVYLRSQNVAVGLAAPVFIVSDHDLISAAARKAFPQTTPISIHSESIASASVVAWSGDHATTEPTRSPRKRNSSASARTT